MTREFDEASLQRHLRWLYGDGPMCTCPHAVAHSHLFGDTWARERDDPACPVHGCPNCGHIGCEGTCR